MNPNTQFERDLEQWLQTEAPASAPAGFHASVMGRARTLRQRPGWATTFPARRLGRGRGLTLLAAAALLVGGALAAGSGLLRLPSVVPPVPEPSVIAVVTASPDAASPSPSGSAAPSASPIPVAGPGGAWIPTGSMVTPRSGNAAVRLLDGRVLVVGGLLDDGLTSADLYDPATGTWSATGDMLHPRGGFPATLLRDGRVLVGDIDGAEVYDPASGTWAATGQMIEGGGSSLTATLLHEGRVLVAGYYDLAQLYDPDSGTWSATRKDNLPGYRHVAILMSDGKVLMAGGEVTTGKPAQYSDSAEVYDPVTGTWTAIANMQVPHSGFGSARLLPDGKVLMTGSVWEVYDPTTGTWTALATPPESMPDLRAWLSDGTVLAGAIDDQPAGNSPGACVAVLFDPRTASLTTTSRMLRCADFASFTVLLDGTVLVAGGADCNGEGLCIPTSAAQLYVPAGVPMPPLPAFPRPAPVVFPDPTPTPTPPPLLPPADGPVPPNARSWKVTVDNESSEAATLFVAEGDDGGTFRLVGSATPNVVPAGATMKVTFLFPAKGPDDGWITVNPRLGEGADVGSIGADNIGIPGKIVIRSEGDTGWLSP